MATGEATLWLKIKTQGKLALDKANQGFEDLKVNAVKAGAALGVMGTAIGKLAIDAAKFEDVKKSFENLTAAQGVNADKLLAKMTEATQGTISQMKLMQQANNALLLGLPVEKFDDMLKIARSASKATGQSMDFMLQSIVTGLGRGSKLILDNLGIIVKTEEAYEKYADTLDTTADKLTDLEKKQAFTNEALRIGLVNAENLGEITLSTADRWDRLKASVENSSVTIGKIFIPTVDAALNSTHGIVGALKDITEVDIDVFFLGMKVWFLDLEEFFTRQIILIKSYPGAIAQVAKKILKDRIPFANLFFDDKEEINKVDETAKKLIDLKKDFDRQREELEEGFLITVEERALESEKKKEEQAIKIAKGKQFKIENLQKAVEEEELKRKKELEKKKAEETEKRITRELNAENKKIQTAAKFAGLQIPKAQKEKEDEIDKIIEEAASGQTQKEMEEFDQMIADIEANIPEIQPAGKKVPQGIIDEAARGDFEPPKEESEEQRRRRRGILDLDPEDQRMIAQGFDFGTTVLAGEEGAKQFLTESIGRFIGEWLGEGLGQPASAFLSAIIENHDQMRTQIDNFSEGIITNSEKLTQGLITFVEEIVDAAPEIAEAFTDASPMIIEKIIERLPRLISVIGKSIIRFIPKTISASFEAIRKAIEEFFSNVFNVKFDEEKLKGIFEDAGEKLKESFKELTDDFNVQVENIREIFSSLGTALDNFGSGIEKAMPIFRDVPEKLKAGFLNFKESLTSLGQSISNFASGFGQQIEMLGTKIASGFTTAITKLQATFSNLGAIASSIGTSLSTFITDLGGLLTTGVQNIVDGVTGISWPDIEPPTITIPEINVDIPDFDDFITELNNAFDTVSDLGPTLRNFASDAANVLTKPFQKFADAVEDLLKIPIPGGGGGDGGFLGKILTGGKANGGLIPGFANGGLIDNTLVSVTPREFVTNRDSTAANIDLLREINASNGRRVSGGNNIHITVNGGMLGNEQEARQFAIAIDDELVKLRQGNESNSFDEDLF
jgi:hypothetical protein